MQGSSSMKPITDHLCDRLLETVCTQHRPVASCPVPQSCAENGCSAVERELLAAAPQPAQPDLHPATADLVRRFAAALAEKLAAAEKKYGWDTHWQSPAWMDQCREQLVEHVAKGDPRDVAAYCAFLWHHGERTALPTQAERVGATVTDTMVDRFLTWPLPDSVCSDPCASMPGHPHRSGTNLMTAVEARQMLEHVLAAGPEPRS